jgi:hypothetical protein
MTVEEKAKEILYNIYIYMGKCPKNNNDDYSHILFMLNEGIQPDELYNCLVRNYHKHYNFIKLNSGFKSYDW